MSDLSGMVPEGESLTTRTTRAAAWRLAASVTGAVSTFVVGVVLARLLTPADFGVMALVFVVIGFLRPLADLGIGGAVVQRAELTERHVRVAFTFSVLSGLCFAAALVVTAPLWAMVLREPIAASVLQVLAAGLVFAGISGVASALLRRRLDFRRQFFIETGSYVLGYGVVAVTLASRGYGLWGLVWGGLCQMLLASGALVASVRHPVRPLLARRELGDLLQFGVGTTLNSCVNYVALNGDNFVIGRWMGTTSLGLYSRAYNLMNLPFTYASSVMTGVLFPAFAQVQANSERLRRGYLQSTQLVALVAASSLGTLAIAAPHLVPSLYGPQWNGVIAPLQILCIAGYFRALYHLGGVVAHSVGWVYRELPNQAAYASLVITSALVGSRYGLPAVASGIGVAILYMYVATSRLALRATGISWHEYLWVQRGALMTAGATCAVALSVRLLLEALHAPSGLIALVLVAWAAFPLAAGMLWSLGDSAFEPIRAHLPRFCVRLCNGLRRPMAQTAVRPL